MPNSSGYFDLTLPFEERVQALIGHMALEEKVSQMLNDCQAIPRLGIPAYNFWSEGLHGVAGNGRATVAEVTIACMGYSPLLENEEGGAILCIENGDRSDMGLPAAQGEFVKKHGTNGAGIKPELWGGRPIAS